MSDANPETIVREFCRSVAAKDLEKLRPLLADDVVYHNIPLEPAKGLDATLEAIAAFFAMFEKIEFQMVNVAAAGDVVLTERVDVLSTAEATAPLPVMGTFEVHDGKIVAWRDYFDMAQVGKILSGG